MKKYVALTLAVTGLYIVAYPLGVTLVSWIATGNAQGVDVFFRAYVVSAAFFAAATVVYLIKER